MNTLKKHWLQLSIRQKMQAFVLCLFLALAASAAMNNYVTRYSLRDVGEILQEITRCENAQDAMRQEENAFRSYVRAKNPENLKKLEQCCTRTASCLNLLPDSYEVIGSERFARTRNIRNSYEYYQARRDEAAERDADAPDAVDKLYEVYTMQDYLQDYLRTLSQLTTQAGSGRYEAKYPMLQSIPYFLAAVSILIFLIMFSFSRLFSDTMLTPLLKLAGSVRRISAGDFGEEDVEVPNKDELGELVSAFNSMKHSTEENINTLKENQQLSERLHREEITRAETERQLGAAQLSLLQSQVNPHFLFNTLNTIAGMAELEEAETTDSMIRSLSNLFRYNLRTTEQFVSLTQELNVVKDYMYLQQMRFGERLRYETELAPGVDTDLISVPVFTLQPLVENSVGHGLSKMERGGVIRIRVELLERQETGEGKAARITIADNGMGMPAERLQEVREALRKSVAGTGTAETAVPAGRDGSHEQAAQDARNGAHEQAAQDAPDHRKVGIGVGNIYRRIYSLYRSGSMTVESREGEGTEITLVIPQEE